MHLCVFFLFLFLFFVVVQLHENTSRKIRKKAEKERPFFSDKKKRNYPIESSNLTKYTMVDADFSKDIYLTQVFSQTILEEDAATALIVLAYCIIWEGCKDSERKMIRYALKKPQSHEYIGTIILEVMKGSLFTTVWNIHARIDDEYSIYLLVPSLSGNIVHDTKILLCHTKGYDAFNRKIHDGSVNWKEWNEIRILLNFTSIGLLTFTRLFVHFLITFPYYIYHAIYCPPMPVTFMYEMHLSLYLSFYLFIYLPIFIFLITIRFNYLLTIRSSPFISKEVHLDFHSDMNVRNIIE
jgi:hypothetical protein